MYKRTKKENWVREIQKVIFLRNLLRVGLWVRKKTNKLFFSYGKEKELGRIKNFKIHRKIHWIC